MDLDTRTKAAVGILAVLVIVAFYRLTNPSTAFAADGVDAQWDAAAKRCENSGRPTVVVFTADWCGWCRKLEGEVLPRSAVQDELQHYNFYIFDLSNPSQAKAMHAHSLGVSGMPTVIRYDKDGHETGRTHYMDADQLIDWLKAGR
jgi:thiol:disulfide interchange protein